MGLVVGVVRSAADTVGLVRVRLAGRHRGAWAPGGIGLVGEARRGLRPTCGRRGLRRPNGEASVYIRSRQVESRYRVTVLIYNLVVEWALGWALA